MNEGSGQTRVLDDTAHELRRVRHETRRRVLIVQSVQALTPRMRRLTFHAPDLADFSSQSYDDHIKLMFPGAGGETVMRDYTPRTFDPAAQSLVIDFALHDAGPATAWAMGARPGDTLQIGGPRGSVIVPDTFDWHLLIGDETALPAIGRRVEELRDGATVLTVCLVDSAEEIQTFDTAAQWRGEWLCRDRLGHDDAALAMAAVDRLLPGQGDGFVFIAGEAQFARTLRAHLAEERGHPIRWMRAAGYWVQGSAGVHQTIS